MPANSAKQARFMQLCRHNPAHAQGKCPSPQVAKEFSQLRQRPVQKPKA